MLHMSEWIHRKRKLCLKSHSFRANCSVYPWPRRCSELRSWLAELTTWHKWLSHSKTATPALRLPWLIVSLALLPRFRFEYFAPFSLSWPQSPLLTGSRFLMASLFTDPTRKIFPKQKNNNHDRLAETYWPICRNSRKPSTMLGLLEMSNFPLVVFHFPLPCDS